MSFFDSLQAFLVGMIAGEFLVTGLWLLVERGRVKQEKLDKRRRLYWEAERTGRRLGADRTVDRRVQYTGRRLLEQNAADADERRAEAAAFLRMAVKQ